MSAAAQITKVRTRCQYDLQEMMQNLVGIVRRENEMLRAVEGLQQLWQRAQSVGVIGHRQFNPGWHTALDLKNLLTVSEAITRAALERKESRGGHFRDDFPDKDAALGKVNVVVKKASDGSMQVRREGIPPMPDYLKQVLRRTNETSESLHCRIGSINPLLSGLCRAIRLSRRVIRFNCCEGRLF
jgi:succinate dehydrogenase/fumarate reductase flavoprotein subunit